MCRVRDWSGGIGNDCAVWRRCDRGCSLPGLTGVWWTRWQDERCFGISGVLVGSMRCVSITLQGYSSSSATWGPALCKSVPSTQPVCATPPMTMLPPLTFAHPLCMMHLDMALRPPAATVCAGTASSAKLLPATVCTGGPWALLPHSWEILALTCYGP